MSVFSIKAYLYNSLLELTVGFSASIMVLPNGYNAKHLLAKFGDRVNAGQAITEAGSVWRDF